MIAALQAHVECMALARASGDLRTIHGHAYPVSEGHLAVWEAQQRELRRQHARKLVSKLGAKHEWRKVFGEA